MGTSHTWVIYPVRLYHQGTPLPVILLLKQLLTHIRDDFDTPRRPCNITWNTIINTVYVHISLCVALESCQHGHTYALVCLQCMQYLPYKQTYHTFKTKIFGSLWNNRSILLRSGVFWYNEGDWIVHSAPKIILCSFFTRAPLMD